VKYLYDKWQKILSWIQTILYPNTDRSAQKLKLFSYQYVLDSPEAKDRIEIAKIYYSAVEIATLFMATWKA
jgi:hypothetical protein